MTWPGTERNTHICDVSECGLIKLLVNTSAEKLKFRKHKMDNAALIDILKLTMVKKITLKNSALFHDSLASFSSMFWFSNLQL